MPSIPTVTASHKIRFGAGNHGRFYSVLKQRVAAHLAARGASRYPDWRLWTKGAVYAAAAIGAYATILFGSLPPWG